MKKIGKAFFAMAMAIVILSISGQLPDITITEPVPEGTLKVHYIDVGEADAIFIQQGKKAMLIDAGENGSGRYVTAYIKKQKIKKLDYIIGTHPHSDHIGGLDDVIRAFPAEKILLPDKAHTSKTFSDVLKAVKERKAKLTRPIPGKDYSLGKAEFKILAPNSRSYDSLNNYSIVIRLVYGKTSFLFTGDAEKLSENEMKKKGYNISSTVLKLGHHGSDTSTSSKFLNRVNPRYAVISVGKNSYGHPDKSVIDRLKKRKIEIYRTDNSGTIIAKSDGKKVEFQEKGRSK